MDSEAILRSHILDILFEKRNKAYGAYMLRKFYPSRLKKSLGFMILTVIFMAAFTFLPGEKKVKIAFVDAVLGNVSRPPVKPEKKKNTSRQISKQTLPQQNKVAGLSRIIINNATTDSIRELVPGPGTSSIDISISGMGDPGTAPGDIEGEGAPADGKFTEKAPIELQPVNNPDVMPQYPGGLNALKRFLEKSLRNPRDLNDGERIGVKVKFVVGYDGKLKGFDLIEDGGAEFNNEVMRVLKKMPGWIPGKSKGQNVSVYYTIPVKFISEE